MSALPAENRGRLAAGIAIFSPVRRVMFEIEPTRVEQSTNYERLVIDIETDVGILQVLAGEAPWRSAIVRDPNSDAHVLPVATSGFTPRDVFGSRAFDALLNMLQQSYDLIIIGGGPAGYVAAIRAAQSALGHTTSATTEKHYLTPDALR